MPVADKRATTCHANTDTGHPAQGRGYGLDIWATHVQVLPRIQHILRSMPFPAAYPHLLAILIHLAQGGEQYVDEISKTPGLVETLLLFLGDDGSRVESGDAMRHAKWRARGKVLALFALLCARGRTAAQSLLSQGGQPFLMIE